MKKSTYVANLLLLFKPVEILASAKAPNKYMTNFDVKLHYVALRRIGYKF